VEIKMLRAQAAKYVKVQTEFRELQFKRKNNA